jgi:purine-nucleoside phosphorylase
MTEQTELKTIQIGDVTYDAASVTELGINIINDIRKVDAKIADKQLTVSIMQLAKAKLIEELEKEKSKFTVVPKEAVLETAKA